jgi:hypothetical protein
MRNPKWKVGDIVGSRVIKSVEPWRTETGKESFRYGYIYTGEDENADLLYCSAETLYRHSK